MTKNERELLTAHLNGLWVHSCIEGISTDVSNWIHDVADEFEIDKKRVFAYEPDAPGSTGNRSE